MQLLLKSEEQKTKSISEGVLGAMWHTIIVTHSKDLTSFGSVSATTFFPIDI